MLWHFEWFFLFPTWSSRKMHHFKYCSLWRGLEVWAVFSLSSLQSYFACKASGHVNLFGFRGAKNYRPVVLCWGIRTTPMPLWWTLPQGHGLWHLPNLVNISPSPKKCVAKTTRAVHLGIWKKIWGIMANRRSPFCAKLKVVYAWVCDTQEHWQLEVIQILPVSICRGFWGWKD